MAPRTITSAAPRMVNPSRRSLRWCQRHAPVRASTATTVLGHGSSALSVAKLYAGFADGFVLDTIDSDLEPGIAALGLATLVTDTIMTDDASRARLAGEVVAFGRSLQPVRS